MKILAAVVFAHFLGDFPLQGDFLANMKGKYGYLLFVHSAIWTGCICVVLAFFGGFAWWKVPYLLGGHYFIDQWKACKEDKTYALTRDLWFDQYLHALQIIPVVLV